MLKINDLHASVDGKQILNGINLEVKAGEIHAIMGPNGSGKSTLASVLAGREEYEVTSGEVIFEGDDLLGPRPRRAGSQGNIPGVPVSSGDTGCNDHQLFENSRKRNS